ncbi:MAG: hypothetical protein H6Q90_6929, partial [Deltaproteobacteria bacterium]|nr:hypothetical protein [Deltaproteobacteria bacterium]
KKKSDQAVVFVCRATANIGMALTKARQSLAEIEASV